MALKARKLLVVDDNPDILQLIKETLSIAGFTNITLANNQTEALQHLHNDSFEFVILDIMLPDGSGFEILRQIRQTSDMPVLFLSAISDIEKQYQGFELGADDYIVKPFRPKELELRILSILRRTYPELDDWIQLAACQLDLARALVIKDNQEISLTAKEFQILQVLIQEKNRIVTLDHILSTVWGPAYTGYENTLMGHIRKIRQKIEDNPSQPKSLLTIKGLGYQLKVLS